MAKPPGSHQLSEPQAPSHLAPNAVYVNDYYTTRQSTPQDSGIWLMTVSKVPEGTELTTYYGELYRGNRTYRFSSLEEEKAERLDGWIFDVYRDNGNEMRVAYNERSKMSVPMEKFIRFYNS